MTAHHRTHSCLVLATMIAAGSAAATPETVVWSARVENDAGPLDGTVSLTLTLFDAATGGSAVHEETVTSAVVVDGELVHELGASAANPIDDAVLDRPELFLQVVLNGETLSPRLPIRAVPYALRAEQCSTLEGLSADDVATDAEMAAALQSISVPFSSLTGVPAGLIDGELTASSSGGLVVNGNTIGIGASAVTSGMIASGAVTSAKLASGSVTAAAIAVNAVGTSEIEDSSIGSVDILNNTITGDDIRDGTIREADVGGVRVYQYNDSCSSSATLLLTSTCTSMLCAGAVGGLPNYYYTCSGQCSATTPQSCNNNPIGKLVN